MLAGKLHPGKREFEDHAFMTGIMSLMPALMNLPIEDIIAPLGLADALREALCDGSGTLGALLRLAECSEGGDLACLADQLAGLPGLGPKALNRAQTQALQWANSIAREKGFARMAVIAAVGTRQYYLDRGFERGEYYLVKKI